MSRAGMSHPYPEIPNHPPSLILPNAISALRANVDTGSRPLSPFEAIRDRPAGYCRIRLGQDTRPPDRPLPDYIISSRDRYRLGTSSNDEIPTLWNASRMIDTHSVCATFL